MTDNLNAALQELQQAIAASAPASAVIDTDVLETRFHGLTLRQLVMLTQAPVLAVRNIQRTANGVGIEQFSIDGKDEDRCELAGRDLVLAGRTDAGADAMREVRIVRDGSPEHSLVLDRNGIVYRVDEREAVVDGDLTAEFRRRRSVAAGYEAASPAAQEPVVITDSFGFRGMAGQVLHGLSAVRVRNGVAIREIERLVKASGEQTLEAACQVADPDALLAAFGEIVNASRQIDALLEALAQRTRMLLSLVEQPHDKPLEGGQEASHDGRGGGERGPGLAGGRSYG
jgi:hypothetical protein